MSSTTSYSWIPSTARVVIVDGFGTIPRGVFQPVPPQLAWPTKDPNDALDYVFDISQALQGNEGDAIASLDVVISPANPGDLTLTSSSVDGMRAILWLSAGFAGTVYIVTITVGTNAGRSLSRTVMLPVQALATPPVPAAAITDQTGAPITDQTGQPITAS
jgi:hypothetical protein